MCAARSAEAMREAVRLRRTSWVRARRRIARGSLAFAASFVAATAAQANLVPNGSFEVGPCPTSVECTTMPNGWICPTHGSTDYFSTCGSSSPSLQLPSTFAGWQPAHPSSGTAYVGFQSGRLHGGGLYSEYLEVRLNQRLQAGETYCAEMYANRSDFRAKVIKPGFLGMLFTVDPVLVSTFEPLFGYASQVQVTNDVAIDDPNNWTRIGGSFVGAGEEYLTIGLFTPSPSDLGFEPQSSTPATHYTLVDALAVGRQPSVSFTLTPSALEGEPIWLDGFASKHETNYYIGICRADQPCYPWYGWAGWHAGEAGLVNLVELVEDSPFEFEGSPGGITYNVTLAVQSICEPFLPQTQSVTVFEPLAGLCDPLLDFEDLAPLVASETQPLAIGTSYEADGFHIEMQPTPSTPIWVYPPGVADSGSTTVTGRANSPGMRLTRVDGKPFTVCSIALSEGESGVSNETLAAEEPLLTFGPPTLPKPVTLNGVLYDAQTVDLPGFDRIAALEAIGYTDVQWDDICICEGFEECANLTSGMVSWWPGENCDGMDRVYHHHGDFDAPSFCPPNAKVGGGALFFEQSNRMVVPDAADLDPGSGELTIAAWVLSSADTGAVPLVAKGPGWELALVDGRPRFTACDTGMQCATAQQQVGPVVTDGAWHHVAATLTRDGANTDLLVYRDGLRTGLNTGVTLGDIDGSEDLVFGAFPFFGTLDEVQLYSRALSNKEILELRLAGGKGICWSGATAVFLGGPQEGFVSLDLGDIGHVWDTSPGQSTSALLDSIATWINGNVQLQPAGISASVSGNALVLSGPGSFVTGISTNDPGLEILTDFPSAPGESLPPRSPFGIPALGLGGRWALAALLGLATLVLVRRQRRMRNSR